MADALRAEGAEVAFVGGERAEVELVPKAGYELNRLRVEPLARRRPLRAARAGAVDARAVLAARGIVRRFSPTVVVGAGGYVSGPVGVAGLMRRVPLVLLEADSHLGLTNRLLAPFAARVCLAFPIEGRDGSRYRVTGRPVPPPATDRPAARGRFGIDRDETCVLVFGGSQGALSINRAALAAFAGARFHVLHAAGERDLPELESPGPHYDLRGYIPDFGEALIASDLVVARAGGSIFEIAAAGRPAVLIPYPYATADHQTANARFMERAGAALVIPDDELSGPRLAPGGRGPARRPQAARGDGERIGCDRETGRREGDRDRGAAGRAPPDSGGMIGSRRHGGSEWVMGLARWALTALAAGLLFALCAPAAWASTTTIDFSTPVIPGTNSPQAGPGLGDQYEAQGVVFAASFPAVGSQIEDPCGGELYRDTANAYSGDQVAFSFCQAHGENFDNDANIEGEIPDLTDAVSVYAGSPAVTINGIQYDGGGQVTTLTAYNTDGKAIAHDTVTVGTKADTLLSVSASGQQIAYFSVSGPAATSVPLEIGELSFEVPATPPPPQIAINPVASGFTQGAQGQTLSVPVSIDRYAGADDSITLAIGGLPTGVTLTGGQTIAADSESTTLTFSIAPNAPASHTQYTLTASTGDASAPPAEQGTFTVTDGLVLSLSQGSIASAACSTSTITIYAQQYATGTMSLSVSSQGDTNGLTDVLSGIKDGQATLTLASNGTGGSGTATYKLTLSDGNVTPQTATLVVNRVGLTAQGLYVTQGTQPDSGELLPSGDGFSGGDYAGVTLVDNKTTVVRLYADATGAPAVSGLLYGYQYGKPLPGSPLAPDYGPLDANGNPEVTLPAAHPDTDEIVPDSELESNANAYTFTLPNSWTYTTAAGAPVQLVGEVQPTGAVLTSGCHASDSFTLNNVTFDEVGNNYNSVIYPIAMTVNGVFPPLPYQVFTDASAVTPLPSGALEVLPYLASVDITAIANTTQGPCGLNPSATGVYSQDPLTNASETAGAACADIKDADVLNSVESFVQNYEGGELNGPHVIGVNLGVARGLTNGVPGQYSVVDGTANYRPLTSVSHELFHQFGLQHASAACGGAGVSWPPDQQGYLDGIGLNTTSEPYQFIAAGSPDFSPPNRAQAYDLMSYCAHAGGDDPNTWVSPRNWQNLISIFGIGCCQAADAASAASAAPKTAPRADPLAALAQVDPARLSVIGFVTRAGVRITSVGPQVGAALPSGTSADSFTLTARGSHGQLLATVPMAATTGGHIDGAAGPLPIVQLSGEVPAAGVDSVQLADDGTVMATRKRPARAPSVRLLSPRAGAKVGAGRTVLVRWRSTNPEHLPLTVVLDYSRNGGRAWRTIFVGPDNGRIALDSFFFTASKDARVRVRVSDGFNETEAVSGRFTALGAPPQVAILTRFSKRIRLAGDARVQLTGTAIDQQAQVLKGRSLRWFDGPFLLGTGTAISAGPLPAGVNHIRLEARDPTGRTASAALTISVSPVKLPFLKLRIPGHVGRGARKLTFRGAASIPAVLRIGGHSFKLSTKARSFTLRISRGRTPLLLALSVTTHGVTTPFAVKVTR